MAIGLSTASFYPMDTQKALIRVGNLDFKQTEIFFNAESELNKDYLKELSAIKNHYGLNVKTIHPMATFAESFTIFSEYKRRFYDGVEFFKKYFEAASYLEFEYLVFHGINNFMHISLDEYIERLHLLSDLANEYGVILAYENIGHCYGGRPENLLHICKEFGGGIKTVMDIKQIRRAGITDDEYLKSLAKYIVQIHISDKNNNSDCMLPGMGDYDFENFFEKMKNTDYKGDFIIEVYKSAYENDFEFIESKKYLEKTI